MSDDATIRRNFFQLWTMSDDDEITKYRNIIRQVTCPYCGAKKDEPCRTVTLEFDKRTSESWFKIGDPVLYVHDNRGMAHLKTIFGF
jgi:hypothetical protein